MLFNSYPFIFAYLPVTVAVFFALARANPTLAASWLTAASLFFYAWWNPAYLGLLVASIALNYALGALIAQANARGAPAQARRLLFLAVGGNLLLLGYFKYAGFFVATVNGVAGTGYSLGEIILPLGISFYTFTQISFLVDVYRGEVSSYRFVHYALFVTYFPHLIAGPILHHREMIPQFLRPSTYRPDLDNVAAGLAIFSMGLAKKVLIADTVGMWSTPVFAAAARGEAPSLVAAWGGALAYTLQLYFDFSGYSDMAIGLSRLFNIDLPLNFNSPYKARSIIEFWRRWHMTLSRFLRDYLYIPLGGGRAGAARRYLNLAITMLLGGLWHGAGWTFVAWGGLHALYLAANHGWRALRGARDDELGSAGFWAESGSRLLTFVAVVVAWVFFRAGSFDAAIRVLRGMVGLHGYAAPPYFAEVARSMLFVPILEDMGWTVSPSWLLAGILAALLSIVWFAPNTQEIMGAHNRALDPYPPRGPRRIVGAIRWRPTPAMAVVTGAVLFASLLGLLSETPSEFLYFQF